MEFSIKMEFGSDKKDCVVYHIQNLGHFILNVFIEKTVIY